MLAGPGGLGRRLAGQRQRRGLSRAQTADRAGVAVSYLQDLEASATAGPGPDVLIRLAGALGTTAAALRGGGRPRPAPGGRPSGAGRADPGPVPGAAGPGRGGPVPVR